jgi:ribosomal protein S18 acetylase RimI-like enzyme
MMNFPNKFGETTGPLPDGLGQAAAEAAQQLAGRGFEVRLGLTTEFAREISAMALEPSIREYCPRDSGERFADLESAGRWLSKGRAMFLLLKRSDNDKLSLAGYGWSGAVSSPKAPGGEITFALRIGETGQGQGLATPFSRLILSASAVLYGAKNIWLETWASNGGAVHVYHKLGFTDVAEALDRRPLPNGGTIADTRIYMSLSNDLLPPAN